MSLRIVEVGPRDGLQNEPITLSLSEKLKFIEKLVEAGLTNIEVGAFVSSKKIPQMADSDRLIKKLLQRSAKKQTRQIRFSALVPNQKGLELARPTGIQEVAVFGACSEKFSQRNINCSVKESFLRFEEVIKSAKKEKIKVRGYLSTAFGCPYEGHVPLKSVIKLTHRLFELGVYEVSIGDTIGVATPKQVRAFLDSLDTDIKKKIAMHFHDTRGTALANVLASLDKGIKNFDSSLGSLGGCPYAKGSSGNLATEDLVYMLEGMGYKTGVDLKKLIAVTKWIEKKIGRSLPSHLGQAGLH